MTDNKNLDLPERLCNAIDGHVETLQGMKKTIKGGDRTITEDLTQLRRDIGKTRDLSEYGA